MLIVFSDSGHSSIVLISGLNMTRWKTGLHQRVPPGESGLTLPENRPDRMFIDQLGYSGAIGYETNIVLAFVSAARTIQSVHTEHE